MIIKEGDGRETISKDLANSEINTIICLFGLSGG